MVTEKTNMVLAPCPVGMTGKKLSTVVGADVGLHLEVKDMARRTMMKTMDGRGLVRLVRKVRDTAGMSGGIEAIGGRAGDFRFEVEVASIMKDGLQALLEDSPKCIAWLFVVDCRVYLTWRASPSEQ